MMGIPSLMHAMGSGAPGSRCDGDAGDLGPRLEGLGQGSSILLGRDVSAAKMEEVVDPVMGGEEALRLARGLEPLHLSALVGQDLYDEATSTLAEASAIIDETGGNGWEPEVHRVAGLLPHSPRPAGGRARSSRESIAGGATPAGQIA